MRKSEEIQHKQSFAVDFYKFPAHGRVCETAEQKIPRFLVVRFRERDAKVRFSGSAVNWPENKMSQKTGNGDLKGAIRRMNSATLYAHREKKHSPPPKEDFQSFLTPSSAWSLFYPLTGKRIWHRPMNDEI